jgi:hypothetical protein
MDIRRELERGHSQAQCLKIADYVGDDSQRFKSLVELFLGGPYRITQRAAWPLSICVEKHPKIVLPHLNKILDFAARPGGHDAVRRNAMRLLQFIAIPPRHQGKALDLAYRFLQDRKEPIAVRVFAMSVIGNLATEKPDLLGELCVIIEDEMPYATPAFRSRGSKILRQAKGLKAK